MATSKSIIKKAGLTTKVINTYLFKGVFGGIESEAVLLQDPDGRVLCYEGKPYAPCGKYDTFATLIETGQLGAECFSFEFINDKWEVIEYPGEQYKGFHIVKSDKIEGWFMTTCRTVVGETLAEVKFDIDSTQRAIDFDNGIYLK